MKANRRFYPKQVARRLAGRPLQSLSVGENSALLFFVGRGRRYGMAWAISDIDPLQAVGAPEAAAVLNNTSTRIFLKM